MLVGVAPASAGNGGRHANFAIDANTGAVLANDDGDEPRHPASLTKMMTLYLTFEAIEAGRLSMRDSVPVSEEAASVPPSSLGLDPGEQISVSDAIRALITKSANDVAVALSERLGGSQSGFVAIMNARARELGMNGTTFRNASGLPDSRQVTTARDMVKLGLALQDHYPQYYKLFATKSFTFRGKTYRNHNTMLNSFGGIDGIKTGYTRSSGFNLVTSVRRGGRHVLAAVFGGASAATRNGEMRVVLTRALTRASTAKTRKETPMLIAKLKSPPKQIRRKTAEPKQVAMADVPPPRPAPRPFAPAKSKPTAAPEPQKAAASQPAQARPDPVAQVLKAPAEFPRYVANLSDDSEGTPAEEAAQPAPTTAATPEAAAASPAGDATPVQVFKVKRIAIAAKSASPDEMTDMPDEITRALMADARETEQSIDRAARATRAALHETNVPKSTPGRAAPRTYESSLDRIAMLGSQPVETAPAAARGGEPADARLVTASATTPTEPERSPAPAPTAPALVSGQTSEPAPVAAAPAEPAAAPLQQITATETLGGGFAIQIGAYVSLDEASRSLATIKSKSGALLANYATTTIPVSKNGRQLYRARFTGFEATAAASTCNELRRQAIDCFVLASSQ